MLSSKMKEDTKQNIAKVAVGALVLILGYMVLVIGAEIVEISVVCGLIVLLVLYLQHSA